MKNMKKKKYTVETSYPYRFYSYDTLSEANEKKSELREQGVKAHIIYVNEEGNDYIITDNM